MPTTILAPPVTRPVVRRAGQTLQWVAALLGAVSLVVAGALAVTGATLVVFRTGSMSPTMPVGALAVVVPVPALSVRPGDVVTVTRPAPALPITHRVVTVEPAAGSSTAAVLELKGDANDSADPQPYQVEEVRRVVASAPYLGLVVERLHTPPVLLVVTLLAAAGVAWAFWPTSSTRSRGGGRHGSRPSGARRHRRARRMPPAPRLPRSPRPSRLSQQPIGGAR